MNCEISSYIHITWWFELFCGKVSCVFSSNSLLTLLVNCVPSYNLAN